MDWLFPTIDSPRSRIAKVHLRQQQEMKDLQEKHNAELDKLHKEVEQTIEKEVDTLRRTKG